MLSWNTSKRFVTSPRVGRNGPIMTSNFVFCVNQTLNHIPGMPFTGNCGTELWPFGQETILFGPINLAHDFGIRPHCQGEPVGHLIRGNTAQAASTNTPATNAAVTIQAHNVIAQLPTCEREYLLQVVNSRPATPVNAPLLSLYLTDYTPHLKSYLIDGFSEGFRLSFNGERKSRCSPNLASAFQQPDIMQTKLDKEWSAERIAGPFSAPPFVNFITSPLGVVPKKSPGDFRIIHHLSYPEGDSVNDFIPDDRSTVHYASISDAISLIKRIGPGCFMAKTDIKSAFRIIPIHPQDYSLVGMKWNDKYFFDRCLPMGCSSSCAIFETFSTSLEWLAKRRLGATGVLHILDDFLFINS